MKLSFSGDALQQAFLRHVEKIAFGFCVLLFVTLVIFGLRVRGVQKSPPELKEYASRTQRAVEDTDPWDQIKELPDRVTLTRYSEAVKEGNVPTEGGLYAYTQPLNPFVPRPIVKRKDPTLYPPVKLIVRGIQASIAYRNPQELPDRLGELKTVMTQPQATRPKSRDDRRSRRGFMGSMPPGYEDGAFPGAGGDESDAEGGMPFFGEGPPPPGVGGATSGSRTPGAPKIFRNPVGWRPTGLVGAMGGAYSGMMSGMPGVAQPPGVPGTSTSPQTSPIHIKPSRIMVVLALVEYEKQWDEYKRTFENAAGYLPARDQPNYVAIAVERAEVPDDPQAPLVWQKIGSTNEALKEVPNWAGIYDEVAHPLYVLGATTLPIPPIVMREIDDLVVHPDIPRKTQQLPSNQSTQPAGSQPSQPSAPDSDVPSDIPSFGPGGARGIPGYPTPPGIPGVSAPPGYPASGVPGAGGVAGGMSGLAPPSVPGGVGFPSAPPGIGFAGSAGGEPDAAGGEMYGMPGGMTGMYPGMGYAANQTLTKYKLVRFFDLTAEPGKTYRYRVQLLLEDPNHPRDPRMDLPPRTLDDAVAARVGELRNKEPKDVPRQHFYRRTEWSEPSEPVSLESPARFYVGPAIRANYARSKSGALLARDPVQISSAAVLWDPNWGVDVSAKLDVMPGGALNVQSDLEVVHPITLEFKKLEKYDLRTNCTLVDLRGGERVGGDSLNPLLSPTEAVFVDAQGKVVVRNEVDDLDLYRRFAFEEEIQESGMSIPGMGEMPPAGMEPGGMAPGGFPPSGPPDAGGRSGTRGRARGRSQDRGS